MTAFKLTVAAVAALVVSAAASAEPSRIGVAGQGSSKGFRISDALANISAAATCGPASSTPPGT